MTAGAGMMAEDGGLDVGMTMQHPFILSWSQDEQMRAATIGQGRGFPLSRE